MTRAPLVPLAAFLVAAALSGCGSLHLGSGHGRKTRAALAAQADRRGAEPAPLDAEDARNVMHRHHGRDLRAGARPPGGATATTLVPVPTSPSSSDRSVVAPIQLEGR